MYTSHNGCLFLYLKRAEELLEFVRNNNISRPLDLALRLEIIKLTYSLKLEPDNYSVAIKSQKLQKIQEEKGQLANAPVIFRITQRYF